MNISEDNIAAVGFIFEKEKGVSHGSYERQEIDSSGLSNTPPDDIANQIIKMLEKKTIDNESFRVSLYWALSKRNEFKLIPYYKKWLNDELEKESSNGVFQLLIALGNLGESVFGDDRNGSHSISDVELNFRDAKVYLEQNA